MSQSIQDNSGFKKLLTISQIYDFFQNSILGGRKPREWLAANVWRARSGERIVDIGCGSATLLEFMPGDVDYLGIDISENYINAARSKFSGRATFFLGTARDYLNRNEARPDADLVLCNGMLHHLSDDDALDVLRISRQLMKSGGRLVCLEPTFLARQTRLSRWFVSRDRGRYVRSEEEWKNLVGLVFDVYSTKILTGLIRIPYTHIIIECIND